MERGWSLADTQRQYVTSANTKSYVSGPVGAYVWTERDVLSFDDYNDREDEALGIDGIMAVFGAPVAFEETDNARTAEWAKSAAFPFDLCPARTGLHGHG